MKNLFISIINNYYNKKLLKYLKILVLKNIQIKIKKIIFYYVLII